MDKNDTGYNRTFYKDYILSVFSKQYINSILIVYDAFNYDYKCKQGITWKHIFPSFVHGLSLFLAWIVAEMFKLCKMMEFPCANNITTQEG